MSTQDVTWSKAVDKVMRKNGRPMKLKEIAELAAKMKGTTFRLAYNNISRMIGDDQRFANGRFEKVMYGTYRRVA